MVLTSLSIVCERHQFQGHDCSDLQSITRHEAAAALSKHGGSGRAAANELLNGDGSEGTHWNSRRLSASI